MFVITLRGIIMDTNEIWWFMPMANIVNYMAYVPMRHINSNLISSAVQNFPQWVISDTNDIWWFMPIYIWLYHVSMHRINSNCFNKIFIFFFRNSIWSGWTEFSAVGNFRYQWHMVVYAYIWLDHVPMHHINSDCFNKIFIFFQKFNLK